jgi:DnaJ-class molecular chaperone
MKRHRSRRINTEVICPTCHGTGFPPVAQPAQPGRKLYPAPCEQCLGKGRISPLITESPEREVLANSHLDQEIAFGLPKH